MKVSCDEGVANRIGPELCTAARKGAREALTGGMWAGILSREMTFIQGADALRSGGRQYGVSRKRERHPDPAWSKTPSTHANFSHGNREIL